MFHLSELSQLDLCNYQPGLLFLFLRIYDIDED